MDVEFKDRKEEPEFVRMALNICGIAIDHKTADLVYRVTQAIEKKKGDFSIRDAVQINADWEKHWKEYFKSKQKENEQD